MVGKLRHGKQITRQTAHQLTCTILIIEIKIQCLQMLEEIIAQICLYIGAKGMSPVGHDILAYRTQHIEADHRDHQDEEQAVLLVWQHILHGISGYQRECQINQGNHHGTDNINHKKLHMRLEIPQKHPEHTIVSPFSKYNL